jgi:hypothetical protein
MSGPYNLRYIHLFVSEIAPGAFILSRNGRIADRVGRADKNLAEELYRAVGEGTYRYFWFEYTPKPAAAFELECVWYHRYHPTDNPDHPQPQIDAEVYCAVKGCSTATLAPAQG